MPAGEGGAERGRGRARDPDHGDVETVVQAERARRDDAVDEDRRGAGENGRARLVGRPRRPREQRRATGHEAVAPVVEVARQRRAARAAGRVPARPRDRERERPARCGGAGERDLAVEQHVQPRPHDHSDRGRVVAEVRRGDRERVRRAAGAADAAVARAGGPLVPGGHDDEGVEPRGALDGACDRAVREGRERLGHADDRDPRGVEHVAVGVGIDGALDPGQQLVGAAVDGEAALGARLPAGDADRQDPRGRDDAADPARAAAAGDQPGQLRSVPLEPRRLVRVRAGDPAALGVEHVEPVQQPVADERVRDVDAGVEEGDGDAAAVEARDAHLRAPASAGSERAALRAPPPRARPGTRPAPDRRRARPGPARAARARVRRSAPRSR